MDDNEIGWILISSWKVGFEDFFMHCCPLNLVPFWNNLLCTYLCQETQRCFKLHAYKIIKKKRNGSWRLLCSMNQHLGHTKMTKQSLKIGETEKKQVFTFSLLLFIYKWLLFYFSPPIIMIVANAPLSLASSLALFSFSFSQTLLNPILSNSSKTMIFF